MILGVQISNGESLGLPTSQYTIAKEDTVILYGRVDMVKEISTRTSEEGDKERIEAIEKTAEVKKEEKERQEEIIEKREDS